MRNKLFRIKALAQHENCSSTRIKSSAVQSTVELLQTYLILPAIRFVYTVHLSNLSNLKFEIYISYHLMLPKTFTYYYVIYSNEQCK